MFINVLSQLIVEKGINKNILAKESGIPYSTIDGFYKKGYENTKLSTLQKLSDYFGVSIDYLISGADFSVSEKEIKIIKAYRKNKDMQIAIDKLLDISAENTVCIYRAAETETGEPDKILNVPKIRIDKLKNAQETDENL